MRISECKTENTQEIIQQRICIPETYFTINISENILQRIYQKKTEYARKHTRIYQKTCYGKYSRKHTTMNIKYIGSIPKNKKKT